jgi:phospholipid/cholesterol/gamma-HCH transport system ATP-binding protein
LPPGSIGLIRKLQGTFELTSVVVTHEMESVRLIADTCACSIRGGVAGIGSLAELEASEHPYIQQFMARRPDDDEVGESDYARQVAGFE